MKTFLFEARFSRWDLLILAVAIILSGVYDNVILGVSIVVVGVIVGAVYDPKIEDR